MSSTIQSPHDKLVRTVFSDPEDAISFLQAYLPVDFVNRINWDSLTLLPLNFIDEAFQKSESDLLFHAQFHENEEGVFLYILFEHQSKPDKWMRFRLLKYMCRIWDESFKENAGQENLIPILPVVFYQGKDSWTHSTAFEDLFVELAKGDFYIPKFCHTLIDQTKYGFDKMKGTVKARLLQILMKAAFHGQLETVYNEIIEALSTLPQTGGINYFRLFILYIITTQDKETVEELANLMKNQHKGGDMLTAAEEYWLEGNKKGKIEGKIAGKIEIIDSFLRAGFGWDMITNATGITLQHFQEIKDELQRLERGNN
jgi:predicted transposase/invertase (TIGR01784 family)